MHSLDQNSSLAQVFFAQANSQAEAIVYSHARDRGEKREWITQNYAQVSARICSLAGQLRALGLKPGDMVAILSASRPEWMEADLAALSLGAVIVSIYPSLAAHEVGYILYDSGAKFVFVENQEQYDKIFELNSEPCLIPATEEREECKVQIGIKHLIAFEAVSGALSALQFSAAIAYTPALSSAEIHLAGREELASLVYTSGTTGPPKGVMQTHGNHLSNVRQVLASGLVGEGASIMIFLPLAHSFAKLMGYLTFLTHCTALFPAVPNPKNSKLDADSVTRDIREGSAEIVPIVPRILEKMQAGIVKRAHEFSPAGLVLRLSLWAAGSIYRKEGWFLARVVYSLTARIRSKIRLKLFGPNFRYAISGGAKLNPEINTFFDSMGIEVLEGYGLTETCVATNANRLGKRKIGTVGPVLAADIELKIAPDGEILYRGPNVTRGYYKREIATRNAWDKEGWFHTGDLGAVDPDGYLSVVGRKKELIVTSYGKKVAPEPIEQVLTNSPYISHAVMLGDSRAYCVALITLDLAVLRNWASAKGLKLGAKPWEADQVVKLIGQAVEHCNRELASFEQIKRFALVGEEFSVENGHLTPTFKVKRREVTKRYADLIESLYRGE